MAYSANINNKTLITYTKIVSNLSPANNVTNLLYTPPANRFLFPLSVHMRMISGTIGSSTNMTVGNNATAYNNFCNFGAIDGFFGTSAFTSPSPLILRRVATDTLTAPSTGIYIKNTGLNVSTNLVIEVTLIFKLFVFA